MTSLSIDMRNTTSAEGNALGAEIVEAFDKVLQRTSRAARSVKVTGDIWVEPDKTDAKVWFSVRVKWTDLDGNAFTSQWETFPVHVKPTTNKVKAALFLPTLNSWISRASLVHPWNHIVDVISNPETFEAATIHDNSGLIGHQYTETLREAYSCGFLPAPLPQDNPFSYKHYLWMMKKYNTQA